MGVWATEVISSICGGSRAQGFVGSGIWGPKRGSMVLRMQDRRVQSLISRVQNRNILKKPWLSSIQNETTDIKPSNRLEPKCGSTLHTRSKAATDFQKLLDVSLPDCLAVGQVFSQSPKHRPDFCQQYLGMAPTWGEVEVPFLHCFLWDYPPLKHCHSLSDLWDVRQNV